MMFNKKSRGSFFERLTGAVDTDEPLDDPAPQETNFRQPLDRNKAEKAPWQEENQDEGQLMVDVYQTNDEIIVQAMIAGVAAQDLKVVITREMVTISGKRQAPGGVQDADYFYRELYWGAFSRTILLPEEIEPDESDAVERHGLLTLRLPKIDKHKQQEIKVKSIV
jgi:HSP20 family protein